MRKQFDTTRNTLLQIKLLYSIISYGIMACGYSYYVFNNYLRSPGNQPFIEETKAETRADFLYCIQAMTEQVCRSHLLQRIRGWCNRIQRASRKSLQSCWPNSSSRPSRNLPVITKGVILQAHTELEWCYRLFLADAYHSTLVNHIKISLLGRNGIRIRKSARTMHVIFWSIRVVPREVLSSLVGRGVFC